MTILSFHKKKIKKTKKLFDSRGASNLSSGTFYGLLRRELS